MQLPLDGNWQGQLDDCFETAARNAGGALGRDYLIGGWPLRLRCAGPVMLDCFGPALEHLRLDQPRSDTELVNCWDAASTGTPPPPIETPSQSPPGTVFTQFGETRQLLYMVGLRSLSVNDAAAGRAWYWTGDARELPSWERASPIRHILHWWLASKGIQQLHAGAVGNDQGAVLVVGSPGRGKSTTTLSALAAGLKYVGDDYVAVRMQPTPVVYSLSNAGKLQPDHLLRFPHLREIATIEDASNDFEPPKAIVYTQQQFPAQTVASLPLVAILAPRLEPGRRCRIQPASRAETLRALAPSTMLQLHVGKQDTFTALAALVSGLPTFTLTLGSDVEVAGPLISTLLEELARRRA